MRSLTPSTLQKLRTDSIAVALVAVVASVGAQTPPPRPVNPPKLTNLKLGALKSGDRIATLLAGSRRHELYATFTAPARTAVSVNLGIEVSVPDCTARGTLDTPLVAVADSKSRPDGTGVVVKDISLKSGDLHVSITVNGSPNPHTYRQAITQISLMRCR